ncbi:MAG: hypothetical protein M3274_03050, partial [Actinomycetota bacterium]|nr:hypothetical protein [Actinomycetota bacterium]
PAGIEPFCEGAHSFPADVAQNEYFPCTILCSLSTAAYGGSPYFKLSRILPCRPNSKRISAKLVAPVEKYFDTDHRLRSCQEAGILLRVPSFRED